MLKLLLLTTAVLSLSLPACASPNPAASTNTAEGSGYQHRNGQLDFELSSGDYACDHGLRVGVQREIQEQVNHRLKIVWQGSHYELARDLSYSGLPRFEDTGSGLVWIDLPWKSVLLDGKTQKPLANECRAL